MDKRNPKIMRLLKASLFLRMPWKNGGGVTHEIARLGEGDDFLWRLSVADVAVSGAFSLFPKHERILTVFDGRGITLRSTDKELQALPLQPQRFSGATQINGVLVDGPCRDFNVIFDPLQFSCDVDVLRGGPLKGAEGRLTGAYIVKSETSQGDFMFLDDERDQFTLADNAVALRVIITPNS
jgi:uncharacterized protein